MFYPPPYLRAVNALTNFNGWASSPIRALVARALRALRAKDRKLAQRERRHLRQIRGMFPEKGSD